MLIDFGTAAVISLIAWFVIGFIFSNHLSNINNNLKAIRTEIPKTLELLSTIAQNVYAMKEQAEHDVSAPATSEQQKAA